MRVVWAEQAWQRLAEIEAFIAKDDPAAASRLVDGLIERGDALSDHPDRGRRLPELPESGLRELVVGNYRLVYRRSSKLIEVLTVFEGHRLLRCEELSDRLPRGGPSPQVDRVRPDAERTPDRSSRDRRPEPPDEHSRSTTKKRRPRK
jgi:plasmid stabilization system protein ParE